MRFSLFVATAVLVAGGYGLYELAGFPRPGGPGSAGPWDREAAARDEADAVRARGPADPLQRADTGMVRYVSETGQIGLAPDVDAVPPGATILPGEGYGGADYGPEEAAERERMRREAARLRSGNLRAADTVDGRTRASARLRRAKRAAARRAARGAN